MQGLVRSFNPEGRKEGAGEEDVENIQSMETSSFRAGKQQAQELQEPATATLAWLILDPTSPPFKISFHLRAGVWNSTNTE